MSRDDFIDAISRMIERRLCDVRVAMPARVTAYDAAKQTADVQPIVRDRRTRGFDTTVEQLPLLRGVPVLFPYGGQFRLLHKVAEGDEVLLVFTDSSLDTYKHQGGEDIDPRDIRRHDYSDAVAIPGLHAQNDAWTGGDIEGVSLGKDAGTQVVVKDGYVGLGGDNLSEPAVLGTAYRDAEDAFFDDLSSALSKLGGVLTATSTALATSATAGGVALAAAGPNLIADMLAAVAKFQLKKTTYVSGTVKVQP